MKFKKRKRNEENQRSSHLIYDKLSNIFMSSSYGEKETDELFLTFYYASKEIPVVLVDPSQPFIMGVDFCILVLLMNARCHV